VGSTLASLGRSLEEFTCQGYLASRLVALSRYRWVPYCLVGVVFTLQHNFIPFIPAWRLVLYRCLAFLPGVLVYMAIYLRTRRLAPIHHRSLDDGPLRPRS
jgi:hypothetical protein